MMHVIAALGRISIEMYDMSSVKLMKIMINAHNVYFNINLMAFVVMLDIPVSHDIFDPLDTMQLHGVYLVQGHFHQ